MSTTATRVAYAGTLDDTTPVTASGINALPGGIIGYGDRDTDTTGTITTENAIQIVDVPVGTGRVLSVRVNGKVRATSATGLEFLIIDGSTTVLRRDDYVAAGSKDSAFSIEVILRSPSGGNHTFTFAYGISGGGGATVNVIADDPGKCIMVVEDLGSDDLA